MQLMPATARRFGADDPLDIGQNIAAGVAYLVWLDTRYDGDVVRMLAAYNAGEANVDRYGGVPPFAETRTYVSAILPTLNGAEAARANQHAPAIAEPEAPFVLTFARGDDEATATID